MPRVSPSRVSANTKPPLNVWLIALSFEAFGVSILVAAVGFGAVGVADDRGTPILDETAVRPRRGDPHEPCAPDAVRLLLRALGAHRQHRRHLHVADGPDRRDALARHAAALDAHLARTAPSLAASAVRAASVPAGTQISDRAPDSAGEPCDGIRREPRVLAQSICRVAVSRSPGRSRPQNLILSPACTVRGALGRSPRVRSTMNVRSKRFFTAMKIVARRTG